VSWIWKNFLYFCIFVFLILYFCIFVFLYFCIFYFCIFYFCIFVFLYFLFILPFIFLEKRDVLSHSQTKILHRIRDFLQGSKLYKWHGYVEKQGVFFHGYRLLIKEAPEPNDINWESIHHTNFDKFYVRVQSYSAWAAILGFGFGVIFLIKYFQEKYLDTVVEKMEDDAVETQKEIDHVFLFSVLMAFLIIMFNKFAVGTAIDYLVE